MTIFGTISLNGFGSAYKHVVPARTDARLRVQLTFNDAGTNSARLKRMRLAKRFDLSSRDQVEVACQWLRLDPYFYLSYPLWHDCTYKRVSAHNGEEHAVVVWLTGVEGDDVQVRDTLLQQGRDSPLMQEYCMAIERRVTILIRECDSEVFGGNRELVPWLKNRVVRFVVDHLSAYPLLPHASDKSIASFRRWTTEVTTREALTVLGNRPRGQSQQSGRVFTLRDEDGVEGIVGSLPAPDQVVLDHALGDALNELIQKYCNRARSRKMRAADRQRSLIYLLLDEWPCSRVIDTLKISREALDALRCRFRRAILPTEDEIHRWCLRQQADVTTEEQTNLCLRQEVLLMRAFATTTRRMTGERFAVLSRELHLTEEFAWQTVTSMLWDHLTAIAQPLEKLNS